MINNRKTIAVFTNQVTATYRRSFCVSINRAATELGYNVVYFNFMGAIEGVQHNYGDYEYKLIDVIPYSQFDGIIFDEEAFTIAGMVDRLVRNIKTKASCPVVSVSSFMEGLYNVVYDDSSGIKQMAEHLYNVHGCRRIGFMSGPLRHPDAVERYKAFKEIMVELGMPEEGVGIFEGDFWFNKSGEAADFFTQAGRERPDAVMCANDYMALGLMEALAERGIRVPEDMMITGFDGTHEGQSHFPKLTTIDRRRDEIAATAVQMIDRICRGEECPRTMKVIVSLMTANTCGCLPVDYKLEADMVNDATARTRQLNYYLGDVTAATLKMNIVESIEDLERVFVTHAVNFGAFRSFALMAYVDGDGCVSYERGIDMPTGRVYPAMLVDKAHDYDGYERRTMDIGEFFPEQTGNRDLPRVSYVMSMHCGERCFGYGIVSMMDTQLFNEFYNVWIATLSVALESLLRQNNILELVKDLENTSVRDELTGLYNRRGFERRSEEAAEKLGGQDDAGAIVIDMDGLKKINDRYGHSEGDFAIRKIAEFIDLSCGAGMIAGRTGGDEFYIFVPGCDEEVLEGFRSSFEEKIAAFNGAGSKPYALGASFGAYLDKLGSPDDLEELLRTADKRMYDVKQQKKRSRTAGYG